MNSGQLDETTRQPNSIQNKVWSIVIGRKHQFDWAVRAISNPFFSRNENEITRPKFQAKNT